jgi:hypothetical protein
MSFEASEDRRNWMTFKGTCMFVDRISNYTPSGGDKPVLFPRADIEKALPSFVNMGVNCQYSDWDTEQLFEGHNSQFKIGTVTSATIQGDEVIITGGLWSWDFADLCDKIKSAKESLGWSIEPLMYLEDKGDYYVASETEFVGVALLWSDKAAFSDTYMFAQKLNKGGNTMNEEKLQAMLAGFMTGVNKAISDNIEGVKAEFSAQINEVAKGVTEGFAKIDAEKAALALQAEKDAEKAKLELEAKAAKDAADAKAALELAEAKKLKDAEDAKVAAELAAKESTARQTMQFGVRVGKFEGDDEAQKAIVADKTLSPGEQFRKLIELRLQSK